MIQPLVAAGLTLEEIANLLFRFGFDAVVSEGWGAVVSVASVTRGQPPEVKVAWGMVISRIMTLETAVE